MHTLDRINADPMILPNISLGCEIRWKLRPRFVMTCQYVVSVWRRGSGVGGRGSGVVHQAEASVFLMQGLVLALCGGAGAEHRVHPGHAGV